MKHERSRVRTFALQALYEIDTVAHPPHEVLARYLEQNSALSEESARFLQKLVMGVVSLAPQLDAWIASCAPEWPVDQLAVLDRNILRMALWEMTLSDETPMKVAINEAIELAKRFGSDSSPRFINGVLGTLSKQEREIRAKLRISE
ncbi:MAG TPA: transcription antitermination factor NusB [Chloroflexi bacterium]|nr:transcription antitermination factor NusB [Chloroflexota bacterium]